MTHRKLMQLICISFFFGDISRAFIKCTCHLNENIVLCLCLSLDLLAYPASIHLFLSHLFSLFVSPIYLPLTPLFFSSLQSFFTFSAFSLFLSTPSVPLSLSQSVCVMKQGRRENINRRRQWERDHGVRGKTERKGELEREKRGGKRGRNRPNSSEKASGRNWNWMQGATRGVSSDSPPI